MVNDYAEEVRQTKQLAKIMNDSFEMLDVSLEHKMMILLEINPKYQKDLGIELIRLMTE
jgi:hypothetical protein